MANKTKVIATGGINSKIQITVDDVEFEIVKQALRAYRQKLIVELEDVIEAEGDNPNNPNVANLHEWIDRTAQFKKDLGDS